MCLRACVRACVRVCVHMYVSTCIFEIVLCYIMLALSNNKYHHIYYIHPRSLLMLPCASEGQDQEQRPKHLFM